jgi:AcrR family transcriptional regulator
MSLSTRTTELPRPRIGKEDWVKAALQLLASQSIEQVRVEPLAESLSVTKGSFYWHFKDREALLDEILNAWLEHATMRVMRHVKEDIRDPRARLKHLLELPFHGSSAQFGADVELAIRGWARRSASVKTAVDRVDRMRFDHMVTIFVDLGFSAGKARERAVLAYAHMQLLSNVRIFDEKELQHLASSTLELLLGSDTDRPKKLASRSRK